MTFQIGSNKKVLQLQMLKCLLNYLERTLDIYSETRINSIWTKVLYVTKEGGEKGKTMKILEEVLDKFIIMVRKTLLSLKRKVY